LDDGEYQASQGHDIVRAHKAFNEDVSVGCCPRCSTDTSESGLFDGSSGFKVLVTSDSSDTQLVENMNTSPFIEGTNEGFFDFYYSS